jgi:hypothetical protein
LEVNRFQVPNERAFFEMLPYPFKDDPLRSPRWRYDRVLYINNQNPVRLRRDDDHEIRALSRLLLELDAAGSDEAKRQSAIDALPAVWQALSWYRCKEPCFRYELEARLLTGESTIELADRYKVDPAALQYFARLFFDVSARLQQSDWLRFAIRGDYRANKKATPEQRRGYVLRYLAAHGGRHALDAMLNHATIPSSIEEITSPRDTLEYDILAASVLISSPISALDVPRLMKIAASAGISKAPKWIAENSGSGWRLASTAFKRAFVVAHRAKSAGPSP